MALTKVGKGGLDKGSIKDQTNLGAAAADADEYLVYDASADALKAITSANVVGSGIITGKDAISIGNVASDDVLLIYDTSAGVLKKITKAAFDALQPGFTSATPANLLTGDGTGNYTVVIAGTDFDTTATFKLVTDGGTDIAMDSVTRDSAVQLTGVVAKNKANLTAANEPFDLVITNGNGLSTTTANAINIDSQPAWVTAAGSLGTIGNYARSSYSLTVTATDPESGAINYALVSGALPGGLSLNTSTGAITGNVTAVASNTTYNFTIEARDTASNATERDFSFVVAAPQSTSFTSSGTFSVPSGLTAVDVLVIAGGGSGGGSNEQAGGGGGAGGLIYRPGFTVSPGGNVSVTVGDGGAGGSGSTSSPSSGNQGQDSVFGTLTAKGGGYGGQHPDNSPNSVGTQGGSGGGGGARAAGAGGSATQPNQSSDSGNYGFGNPGGSSSPQNAPSDDGGGGGGGAGAAGGNAQAHPGKAGDGGAGRAYTIADGTTSVYYAGGGGGGCDYAGPGRGAGGNGGGGAGEYENQNNAAVGTANRGGGGGGTGQNPGRNKAGGKGIVIVRY